MGSRRCGRNSPINAFVVALSPIRQRLPLTVLHARSQSGTIEGPRIPGTIRKGIDWRCLIVNTRSRASLRATATVMGYWTVATAGAGTDRLRKGDLSVAGGERLTWPSADEPDSIALIGPRARGDVLDVDSDPLGHVRRRDHCFS